MIKKWAKFTSLLVFLSLILGECLIAYPVDGYKESGIRRIERLRIRLAGKLKGPVPVNGARRLMSEIQLHLFKMPTSAPSDSALADSAFFDAVLREHHRSGTIDFSE